MLEGLPQEYLALVAAAFVLGWLVAKFGAFLSARLKSTTRDPRDDRIRSLEAENRIAVTDSGKAKDAVDELKKELKELQATLEEKDSSLETAAQKVLQLRTDLKGSVKKTRELRSDLSERATENVKSEVKLREVETELEVSRAATDMIATGVLDYSVIPEGELFIEEDDDEVSLKTAT